MSPHFSRPISVSPSTLSSSSQQNQQRQLLLATCALLTTAIAAYALYSSRDLSAKSPKGVGDGSHDGDNGSEAKTNAKTTEGTIASTSEEEIAAALAKSKKAAAEKLYRHELQKRLEKADASAKVHFKSGDYLAAAAGFSEALTLCSEFGNLVKQKVTLLNNRSAMYEKSGMFQEALDDCQAVLDIEKNHVKARLKRSRIFEVNLNEPFKALIEIYAVLIDWNRVNGEQNQRQQLAGVPPMASPVEDSQVLRVTNLCLPKFIEEAKRGQKACSEDYKNKKLVDYHTISLQLAGHEGYGAWVTDTLKGDSVSAINERLYALGEADEHAVNAKKADILYERGIRLTAEKKYVEASDSFKFAYDLACKDEEVKILMVEFKDLLCWVATFKRFLNNSGDAIRIFEECIQCYVTESGSPPTSSLKEIKLKIADIYIKIAIILMDDKKLEESSVYLDKADELVPNFADVHFNRSQYHSIMAAVAGADVALEAGNVRTAVEKCLLVAPSFVRAHMIRSELLKHEKDMEGSLNALVTAESLCSKGDEFLLSDIYIQRSELALAKNEESPTAEDIEAAKMLCQKSIDSDKTNSMAYMIMGVICINYSPPQNPDDMTRLTGLLEKAIELNPKLFQAYMYLTEIKGMTGSDVTEIDDLFERGIRECPTEEGTENLVARKIAFQAQMKAVPLLQR